MNDGAIIREEDFVTTEEAAEILGLRRSQARAVLGEPDHSWYSAAGRIQFVFRLDRVLDIKARREEHFRKRAAQLGFRSCLHCNSKFSPKELCDGLCTDCQARKLVRNFACRRGDFFRKELDAQRLRALSEAVRHFAELDSKNAH
ncbi:MAG: hypothetical protein IJW33_02510 [Lentisphaeria bacterium]|nr:hypothetical protein [Lentisphaeria bacterium]